MEVALRYIQKYGRKCGNELSTTRPRVRPLSCRGLVGNYKLSMADDQEAGVGKRARPLLGNLI